MSWKNKAEPLDTQATNAAPSWRQQAEPLDSQQTTPEPGPVPEPVQAQEEGPGLASNAARMAGERSMDLIGNLVQFAGTLVESGEKKLTDALGGFNPGLRLDSVDNLREQGHEPDLAIGSFGLDFTGRLDPEETDLNLQQAGQAAEDVGFGYQPDYTIKKALEEPTVENIIGAAAENGPAALADMAGLVISAPAYLMSRTQEIAEARVQNNLNNIDKASPELQKALVDNFAKGTPIPEELQAEADELALPGWDDYKIAGPAAAASVLVDRFALSKLLPGGKPVTSWRDLPGAVGNAMVTEGGTEMLQEGGIEYAGESLGTKQGWQGDQALERAAGGLIVGAPTGGAVRVGTGAYELRQNQKQAAEGEPEPLDDTPILDPDTQGIDIPEGLREEDRPQNQEPADDAAAMGLQVPEEQAVPQPESEPAQQPAEPEQEAGAGQTRYGLSDNGTGVFRVPVDQIQVDPKSYQFRSRVNEEGVDDRLSGVTEWDDKRSDNLILHRRKDGSLYVADGHHRLQLAKRLGQTEINAQILDEQTEGATVADARTEAALKNIAQGNGEPLDVAKVFRDSGVDPADVRAEFNLPRSEIVNDGENLAKLGDNVFGMVSAGQLPEKDGATIGRYFEDPAKQEAAAREFQTFKPSNAYKRELLAKEIQAADFEAEQGEQGGLFGDDPVETSLMKHRLNVLDSLRQALNRDKKLFTSLNDNADRASEAGNQIATEANQEISETSAKTLDLIGRVSTTPALNDMVRRATERLYQGEPKKDVIRDLKQELLSYEQGQQVPESAGSTGGRPTPAPGTEQRPDQRVPENNPAGAGEGGQPQSPGAGPEVGSFRDLDKIPDSALIAFPDMTEAEGGLLPLSRFTPDEQAGLRAAGIVQAATTSTGNTYDGVDAEDLWQARSDRQKKPGTDTAPAPSEPRGLRQIRSDFESNKDNPDALQELLNELWPMIEGQTGARANAAESLYQQIQNAMEPADFDLASQTEEELAQQAADQNAAQATEAEARRKEEERIRADEQLGDFTLTGSSRPVDEAEARGQGNMFDEPAEPESEQPAQESESVADDPGKPILDDAPNPKEGEFVGGTWTRQGQWDPEPSIAHTFKGKTFRVLYGKEAVAGDVPNIARKLNLADDSSRIFMVQHGSDEHQPGKALDTLIEYARDQGYAVIDFPSYMVGKDGKGTSLSSSVDQSHLEEAGFVPNERSPGDYIYVLDEGALIQKPTSEQTRKAVNFFGGRPDSDLADAIRWGWTPSERPGWILGNSSQKPFGTLDGAVKSARKRTRETGQPHAAVRVREIPLDPTSTRPMTNEDLDNVKSVMGGDDVFMVVRFPEDPALKEAAISMFPEESRELSVGLDRDNVFYPDKTAKPKPAKSAKPATKPKPKKVPAAEGETYRERFRERDRLINSATSEAEIDAIMADEMKDADRDPEGTSILSVAADTRRGQIQDGTVEPAEEVTEEAAGEVTGDVTAELMNADLDDIASMLDEELGTNPEENLGEPEAAEPDPEPEITRQDVENSEGFVKELLYNKLRSLKAEEARKIAKRFLPTQGVKAPTSRSDITAAVTDFAKVNPLAAAGAFNVEMAESVRRALEADMEGLVADESEQSKPKARAEKTEEQKAEAAEKRKRATIQKRRDTGKLTRSNGQPWKSKAGALTQARKWHLQNTHYPFGEGNSWKLHQLPTLGQELSDLTGWLGDNSTGYLYGFDPSDIDAVMAWTGGSKVKFKPEMDGGTGGSVSLMKTGPKPEPGDTVIRVDDPERALRRVKAAAMEPNARLAFLDDPYPDLVPQSRSASEIAKSFGSNVSSAGINAIDGLTKLFGGPGRLSSGLTFDEETYAQAKPHFKALLRDVQAAGKDLREFVRLVANSFGAGVKPYLLRFVKDVQDGTIDLNSTEDTNDVPGSNADLESDSQEPGTGDGVGQNPVLDESGADGAGNGEPGGGPEQGGASGQGGPGVPGSRPAAGGKRSDQPAHSGDGQFGAPKRPAGSDDTQGSGQADDSGVRTEPGTSQAASEVAAESRQQKLDAEARKKAQAATEAADLPIEPGNDANIAEHLPMLLPDQQGDVAFFERRLLNNKGHGVLTTNGTGTGKTFSGLGLIKRYARMGRDNILIVVPNNKIASDWIGSGKALALDVKQLVDTQDNGGDGVVITTYANFRDNNSLLERTWDLTVFDESHYLHQSNDFEPTQAENMRNALTGHPRGRYEYHVRKHAEEYQQLQDMAESIKSMVRLRALDDTMDQKRDQLQRDIERLEQQSEALRKKLEADREREEANRAELWERNATDTLMLSATPFPYRFSVDSAEGYLFNYDTQKPGEDLEYNKGNAREQFFMANFGYRMRYNKLTQPESGVDLGLMEREFANKLQRDGVMRSRMLEVDQDYDRQFYEVESQVGRKVDEGLMWLDKEADATEDEDLARGLRELAYAIREKFDYLSRAYFLEAVKAKEMAPVIREHLHMGRKVVVFHDFNKGGSTNPFVMPGLSEASNGRVSADGEAPSAELKAAYQLFVDKRPDLQKLPLADLVSPRERFASEFPDALFFNGQVPKGQRIQNADLFNDDNSGRDLIVVQSDAGREGVSLHDTTGKHQRVLINLGLPSKPIASIQTEGRIYRTFVKSNAIQRYVSTGLSMERWAIASKLAERSGTAENLAMGDQARGLKEAILEAYEMAGDYPPGHDGEGVGGKERDRALVVPMTDFDRAKTYYFGTAKNTKKRDQREGRDYFATPEPLGQKMVEWADVAANERILEPSAGHGAILRWMHEDRDVHYVEPSTDLASKAALRAPHAKYHDGGFEDLALQNKYDAVVMNPPYGQGGSTAWEHVAKAARHLKDGGRIVALVPQGPAADKAQQRFMESDQAKEVYTAGEIIMPPVTFERAGTNVRTKVVILERHTKADNAPNPFTRSVEYAEDINEFFNEIEGITVPERTRPEPVARPEARSTGPASGALPELVTAETRHAKKGIDLYVARVQNKIDDYEDFKRLKPIAQEHNGYYSKFKKNGAIPGFQFETEQDRADFLAAAEPVMEEIRQKQTAQLKRGATPLGMRKSSVQSVVNRLTGNWKDAPEIKVVQSLREMPKSLQSYIASQRAEADVEAALHEGQVWILAPRMESPQMVEAVILHEVVGHFGVKSLMGPEIKPFYNTVYREMGNSQMAEAIKKTYFDPKTNPFDPKKQAHRHLVADELMAHLAERKEHMTLWNRFVALFRDALRRLGFTLPLGRNDILMILRKAHEAVAGGGLVKGMRYDAALRRAWHGSPHRFDRFSLEAIGTGEGFQAYGYGLYFAGSRGVAEWYRKTLAPNQSVTRHIDTQSIHYALEGNDDPQAAMDHVRDGMEMDLQNAEDDGRVSGQTLENMADFINKVHQDPILNGLAERASLNSDYYGELADLVDNRVDSLAAEYGGDDGHLYEVHIPEDDEFLNYDKALSDQPEQVREQLQPALDLLIEKKPLFAEPIRKGTVSGQTVYQLLGQVLENEGEASFAGGPEAASRYLRSLGLPGLRYLDGNSRSAGEGAYNYVVWDDQVVTVAAINDQIIQAATQLSRNGGPDLPTMGVEEGTTDEQARRLLSEYQARRNRGSARRERAETAARTLSGRKADQSWRQAARVLGQEGILRAYRGGRRGLSPIDFSEEALGVASQNPNAALGVWFTTSARDAENYGNRQAFYLNLQNPQIFTADNAPDFESQAQAARYRDRLKQSGYDGIIFDYREAGGPVHFVAFDADQIVVPDDTDARLSRGKGTYELTLAEAEYRARRLAGEVQAAYEAGDMDLAERLDEELESLYQRLEDGLSEREEDGLPAEWELRRMSAGTGDATDAEAGLMDALAATWNDYINGFGAMERENVIENGRANIETFGGNPDNATDQQILEAMEDAWENHGKNRADRRPPKRSFGRDPSEVTQLRRGGVDRSREGRLAAFFKGIASQPIDRMFRLVFDVAGLVDSHGRLKPGVKIADKAEQILKTWTPGGKGTFTWLNGPLELARNGLIDRYKLTDEYRQTGREAEAYGRKIDMQAMDILKVLEERGVQGDEARVLQDILTGEQVDNERLQALAPEIQRAIDDLGQQAVEYGIISRESFERNRGQYLHRSYLKYEGEFTSLGRFVHNLQRKRNRAIQGDTAKGRGKFVKVKMGDLVSHLPSDWFGLKKQNGKVDRQKLNRQKFVVLEDPGLITERSGQLFNEQDVDQAQKRRQGRRVYWPASKPVPPKWRDWINHGTFEVRSAVGERVVLWRDWTKEERQNMGEILDARYNIAKTFQLMSQDLAKGKLFHDIAQNGEWFSRDYPQDGGKVLEATRQANLVNLSTHDWVLVPDTSIDKTGGTKRWGALAGGYVRAEIFRDLLELDKMQNPGTWRKIMTQWKLNKTARSPVVHTNNVMSNLVFMDMADVRFTDLFKGINSYRKRDQYWREAQEYGAFEGTFVNEEIRRQVLDPILDDLAKQDQQYQADLGGKIEALNAMTNAIWRALKKADRVMVNAYQLEDELFRMAMYIRRRELGDSALEAAIMAREQFLDYDIRAPWVNAARRTVLPFIAYTYRAIPVIAKSMAHRPWKLAKYATIAYLVEELAFAMAGGDEDEERRTMRTQEQGSTWIGTNRMLRMPYNDEYGNPVYLDIRRWIPAGDVFDMNQGQSAVPIPAPLQFGGLIMLGAEFILNKQAFTGKEISNRATGTLGEQIDKTADWLYKSWMPSAAYIPGSYYWDKFWRAWDGGRDILGRPYSPVQAAVSSVGIKLQPHDVQLGYAFRSMDLDKQADQIQLEMRQAQDDLDRNRIDQARFNEIQESSRAKLQRLQEKVEELRGW